MNPTHEVISAFVDDEPFDPQALATALSDERGRELVIDRGELRRLVQPEVGVPPTQFMRAVRRFGWRPAVAAAAVCLALAGGYVLGDRRAAAPAAEAPQPTRVVQAVPFVPDGDLR
jgi:hypothetical protein